MMVVNMNISDWLLFDWLRVLLRTGQVVTPRSEPLNPTTQSLEMSESKFFSLECKVSTPHVGMTRTGRMQTRPGLKGVFAKNERGYRLNAIKKRFWSLLILLLSVKPIRRKLLKTTYAEGCSVHANSESCNIRLGS